MIRFYLKIMNFSGVQQKASLHVLRSGGKLNKFVQIKLYRMAGDNWCPDSGTIQMFLCEVKQGDWPFPIRLFIE